MELKFSEVATGYFLIFHFRFQRLNSPDIVVLSSGRKSGLKPSEEYDAVEDNGFPSCSPLEVKALKGKPNAASDYRSPSRDPPFFNVSSSEAAVHTYGIPSSSLTSTLPAPTKDLGNHQVNGASHGDVLFQWGHRKRSRWLRTEARASSVAAPAAAEGSESPAHSRQMVKLQRRSSAAPAAAAALALPTPCGPYATRTRPCHPGRDSRASLANRSVEDRSEGRARPEKRSPPEKVLRSPPIAFGSDAADPDPKQLPLASDSKPSTAKERINLDHFEWPRIQLCLSRKEKEDDFLAMKGTKLPQRPKKRAKNIDRTLQYCFPGMWLSELTRGRYEVREKKCVKKKRRGLKGMESLDSDSE
ncbi:uncharacterized protein LOC122027797 isoform X3 [Zingiber officinale]|uniref:uncharacterized protein LOC122027797 isoform X3 n=1 Tax=Zingiber officinale TaxID=94328 RepID=UPI001C4CDE4C|nr:uncharacterized protein LOC122027797 isoform X3 [Zingiber officinale]